MTDGQDDIKKLIQLAVPHDFGATLRYIDNRTNELIKLLDNNSLIAKYVPKYNFMSRLERIREISNILDEKFDSFWDNEASRDDYFELEQAFNTEISPLLAAIAENAQVISRLLAKTRERFSGFARDSRAAQRLVEAEDLVSKIIYFSNRSKYYARGLIDLYAFSPVEKPEITNLNKFIVQMNEFFHLPESREEIVVLNSLPTLKIDYSHCYTLFSNLIKNALKYKRGPRARMYICAEGVSGDFVRIERRLPFYVPVGQTPEGHIALHFFDEGVGIQAEKLQLIFQPFKRGIAPETAAALADRDRRHGRQARDGSSYSDMGIGLAVAMRVATLYGGNIYANSTPGRGACITITIPDSMVH